MRVIYVECPCNFTSINVFILSPQSSGIIAFIAWSPLPGGMLLVIYCATIAPIMDLPIQARGLILDGLRRRVLFPTPCEGERVNTHSL